MHVPFHGGASAHRFRFPAASVLAILLAAGPSRAQEVTGGATQVWEADLQTEIPVHDRNSRVAAAGERIFLAALTNMVALYGSEPGLEVTAYDAASGAIAWSVAILLLDPGSDISALTVSPDGARLYAAVESLFSPGLLVGVDAATGAQLFQSEYDPSLDGTALRALAVSPDGTRLYAAGGTGYKSFYVGSSIHMGFHVQLTAAFDAAGGQLLWEDFYDGGQFELDEAVDLAVSPNGALVFVTGTSMGIATGTWTDYLTFAYSAASGARQWIARYSTGLDTTDQATQLAMSPDGTRLVVAGAAAGGDEIVSYDAATGTQLWTSSVETALAVEHADAVFSPDGSAVFVQALQGTSSTRIARLSAADGAVTWTYDQLSAFPGASSGALPRGLAVSPGGERVFASIENSLAVGGPDEALTLALRASHGTLEWEAHDTAAPHDLEPRGIVLSAGGQRVAVAAERDPGSPPATFDQLVTVRSAASGAGLWQAVLDGKGPGSERARSVAVAPDGSTSAVAVVTSGDSDFADLFVVDAAGATLWSKRAAQPSDPFANTRTLVAYAPDGATVFRTRLAPDGVAVEAYGAAAGAERWSALLAGVDVSSSEGSAPDHDFAVDGAAGRVFVSRTYQDQMLVTALDPATGAVLWEASGGSMGLYARAFALAVAPDGARVFVTGSAVILPSQGADMFTAAYDAASGAPLWLATYSSLGGPLEQEGRDVTVSTDGAWVAVSGLTDGLYGVAAVYSAATGAEAWAKQLFGLNGVYGIAADDQHLYLLGGLFGGFPPTGGTLGVRALELATGAFAWETGHEQDGVYFGFGSDLELERDGTTLFATGTTTQIPGPSLALTLAFDSATGAILWSATHDGGAVESGEALALDAAGHVLLVASTQDGGASFNDTHLAAYAVPSLVGQPAAFSASAGGGQELFLRADAQHAGGVFLIMGSFAGTAPGFDVQGVHVPLNPDWYLPVSINAAMSPVVGAFGLLGPEGLAEALVAVPAGVALPLVGMTVAHAYGVADPLSGTAEFASNPVLLAIEP